MQSKYETRSHGAAETSGSLKSFPFPELIITCAQEAGRVSRGRLLPPYYC